MVKRLAVFGAVAVVAAATSVAGWWFVPFVAGVAAGLLSLRWTGIVLAAVLGAVAGWALPLWILALRGYPAGATAHVIAALAGLPPYATVTVAATLLLAALQVLTGAWLARAFAPAWIPGPGGIPGRSRTRRLPWKQIRSSAARPECRWGGIP